MVFETLSRIGLLVCIFLSTFPLWALCVSGCIVLQFLSSLYSPYYFRQKTRHWVLGISVAVCPSFFFLLWAWDMASSYFLHFLLSIFYVAFPPVIARYRVWVVATSGTIRYTTNRERRRCDAGSTGRHGQEGGDRAESKAWRVSLKGCPSCLPTAVVYCRQRRRRLLLMTTASRGRVSPLILSKRAMARGRSQKTRSILLRSRIRNISCSIYPGILHE